MRAPPVLLALMMLVATPAPAQVRGATPAQVRDAAPEEDRAPPPQVDDSWVRAPKADTGRIGQRQTREDAARATGIKPMARINNRINNRVQTRLRNRIDRNYDPSPDIGSAFEAAEEQISASGQPR